LSENVIKYEDFAKLDLRIGTIKLAERISGSKKLIKLLVDLGELGERQIVAGIGEKYEPAQLVGKQIVVVANLAPKKLMGHVSQGMLLAAGCDDGVPVLLSPIEHVKNGSKVC
jgi:methionine--tRNA ligase beta chain